MVAFPSGEAAGEETIASTVRRRAAAGDAGRGQQGRPGLKRPLKPTGTEPVRQPMVLFSLAAPAVMAASVQAAARGMRIREGTVLLVCKQSLCQIEQVPDGLQWRGFLCGVDIPRMGSCLISS